MTEQVYSTQSDPDIEIEGRRFRRVALKAPNIAPLEIGVEDLKREIESLHRLTHKNIVQILGMVHSKNMTDHIWTLSQTMSCWREIVPHSTSRRLGTSPS